MNLTFLNPIFLYGLAAGILPILIHRLTQRKPAFKKFSAVRLLLQSQRVIARPQRLKHLFLLALRVLAIITLALLMAQPVLWRLGLRTLGKAGANVILIDNSLSMAYQEERGERFVIAQKAAREAIERLQGKFLILPTVPRGGGELHWGKRDQALQSLAAIPFSFGRGDPSSAFTLAYRELQNLQGPKEVLILSDFARGDWEGFHLSSLGPVSSEVGLTFLRIGGGKRDSNFAVKEIRRVEGEAVVGLPSRLECTVANLSDQSGSILVQLLLSGTKVEQKGMDLNAGEEGRVSFEVLGDRIGWVHGEIRLTPDRLPVDDVFYFPLRFRERVRVLIVDGDPRTHLQGSESYYLAQALNPGKGEGSPFLLKVIADTELSGIDLSPYEALFLLNVAQPPAFKIAAFLESGRPLFIFLGDRVDPEHYHRFPLFPWVLQGVKAADGRKPLRIGWVDLAHESIRILSGPRGDGLKAASFHRYYRIQGGPKSLLTLENQDPLLLEANLGKGKIFLFTSSADLDWNDFPLKTAYLPLIQGLLKEAVGLGREVLPVHRRWGEPLAQKMNPVQLVGPQGGPGIYQLHLPSGELRQGVNLPYEESDLRKMTPEEMKRKFERMNSQWLEYEEGALSRMPGGRMELWPYLLIFLFLLLGVEIGVANRL